MRCSCCAAASWCSPAGWVPLFVLSVAEGRVGRAYATVLYDEAHARLLLAIPLMVVAELVVHSRMRLVLRQFVDRGLVPDAGCRGSRRHRFGDPAAQLHHRGGLAHRLRLRHRCGHHRARRSLPVASWHTVQVDGVWRPRWPDGGKAASACRCSSSCSALVAPALHLGAAAVADPRAPICRSCRRTRTAAAGWGSWRPSATRSRHC